MLICPSFFDGRFDGIGRVSGAFFGAMTRMNGEAPLVLSANDPVGACPPAAGRCFGRGHAGMFLSALTLPWGASRTSQKKMGGARTLACTHLGLSPVARVLAARWRRPYLVFIHGVEAWKRLPVRSRWGVSGADCLFFNSEFTRRSFLRFNPWAAPLPSVVVPLGLTLSKPGAGAEAALTSARGVREEATPTRGGYRSGAGFRVLIVGRMTKAEYYEGFRDTTDLYKGFKQLILAVGQLAATVPDVRLWIVGDGDARPELEQWLSTRPEQPRVEFFGRVSDERLHQLYEEADVFALPSEGEGFGLVFAEAMAHGLPCVCVNAGAAPEVVEDGETGLAARPRDVDDLVDKLFVLAGNPRLRARLGAAARRAYEAKFTAAAFEDRLVAALGAVRGRS